MSRIAWREFPGTTGCVRRAGHISQSAINAARGGKLTFIQTPLEVLQTPQLLVSWRPALELGHFCPQLRINSRLLRKLEEHVAEQAGRRVSSRQQDVDKFLSDSLLVLGLFRNLLNEEVFLALARPGLLLFVQLLPETQRIIHILVNVRMADADSVIALFVFPEAVEDTIAHAHRTVFLGEIEGFAEDAVFVGCVLLSKHAKRVGRVVEEELGGRVNGEGEEELLQIHRRPISRDMLEHELEMPLKRFQVRHLVFCKIRTQQIPAVSPTLAIGNKDSMTQQRRHGVRAVAQTVVFEFQTQNRLDVFRLDGDNPWCCDDAVVVRVAESLKPGLVLLQDDVVFAVVVDHLQHVEAKDGVFVVLCGAGLAPVFLHEAPPSIVESNACVEDVGEESAGDGNKKRRVCHGVQVEKGNVIRRDKRLGMYKER